MFCAVSKLLTANKSRCVLWWLTVLVTKVYAELDVVQFYIAVQ